MGLYNAHIQMKGTDNLFRISNDEELIQVNLKELDLEGCGKSSCAEQGGLIHNKGKLIIDYSRLYKGLRVKVVPFIMWGNLARI